MAKKEEVKSYLLLHYHDRKSLIKLSNKLSAPNETTAS